MSADNVFVAAEDIRLVLDLAFDIKRRSMNEITAMRRLLVAIGYPVEDAIRVAMQGLTEIIETSYMDVAS